MEVSAGTAQLNTQHNCLGTQLTQAKTPMGNEISLGFPSGCNEEHLREIFLELESETEKKLLPFQMALI